MKTELILLGVIGAVFLLDFLLKGVKKKKLTNKLVDIDGEKSETQKQISTKPIYFLFALVFSIIIGAILTYLFDKFNYPNLSLKSIIRNIRLFPLPYITNFIIYFGITLILILVLVKYDLLKIKSLLGSALLYILNRKKNIVLFILSSCMLKLCIHYFVYPSTYRNRAINGRYKIGEPYGPRDFSWHIDNLLSEKTNLLIAAVIIISIVAWLLNDKIKAR